MTATKPVPRPTRPAPQSAPPPPPRRAVTFGAIQSGGGHRVLLYGPGGIGKTTLAAQLPGPVAMIDLDESLPRLRGQLETAGILDNVRAVDGVTNWQGLRDVLQSDGWDGIASVVIDTGTRAEEMAVAHTLEHTLQDGKRATSIEGYGYGKGYGYVFDTFAGLIGDMDSHARAGRNVVLVCHDCTTNVPNPAGEDWIRYEPRLQAPNSGKASIRLRAKEWADHVLYIGYDVAVGKDGKGQGSGTRTMYTAELPHCMAKSRTTAEQIVVGLDGPAVWSAVLK